MKTVQELIDDLQQLVTKNPATANMEVVAIHNGHRCVPLGEPQMGHMDEETDFWDTSSIMDWNDSELYNADPKAINVVGI